MGRVGGPKAAEAAPGPGPGRPGRAGLPSREALLRYLARAAALSTGADEVAVSSVLPDGRLRLVHCTGRRAVAAERCQAGTGRGPGPVAVRRGRTVAVRDLRTGQTDVGVRVRALLGDLASVASVPLVSCGRVNAVLDLWWSRQGGPSPAQDAAIEHLQRVAASVLELVEEQDPAYRDPEVGARSVGWDL